MTQPTAAAVPTPALSARAVDRPAFRGGLLLVFAALSLATLGIGGWLTSLGFGTWYDELPKPAFQPPGWVFGPVWTTLFALLAVATWQVARRGSAARRALQLYAAQLVFNVLWSLLFFTLHRPDLALIDIAVLDVLVLMMVASYGRVHRASGWLLVPYAVWLGLATTINVWIVLNS